jgi:CheY-like chemotaxis protein
MLTTNVRRLDRNFPYGLDTLSKRNLEEPIEKSRRSGVIPEQARSVFVVDDELLIADSVAEILRNSGYAATAFYDGHDAIEEAQKRCPDIVVSDVLMPEINGIQMAIAIRSHCPATRIILFSGQAATVELLRDAERNGNFFELLPKPIHPRQLLKALTS